MTKMIPLVLLSLGTQVHADAENQLANNLGGRATVWIGLSTDLDDSTLGKAPKVADAGPTIQSKFFVGGQSGDRDSGIRGVANNDRKIFGQEGKTQDGKRIFGGTNSRNNKNPAVMAKLKGKAALMYGAETKRSVP